MRLRVPLLAFAVAVGLLAPSATVAARAENSISKTVTVVVDFGKKSGRATRVIALSNISTSATGWTLLAQTKLKIEGTQQYPTGFVCRIAGWPTSKQQDCADTPTYKEGHWAYYVTSFSRGGGWLLSGQGAASHVPDCAGYEGWSWIAGGEANKPPRFKVENRACK
jgi:hypothetical protein